MYYQEVTINSITHKLAPFWKRMAAMLIDVGIAFSLLYIPFINFPLMFIYLMFRDAWSPFPWSKGGSIGKLVMGLRVISLAHGTDLSGDYQSSVGRSLSLFLVGLDFMVIFFRRDRRRIGDLWSKTVVVKNSKTPGDHQVNKDRYVDIINEYYPSYKAIDDTIKWS